MPDNKGLKPLIKPTPGPMGVNDAASPDRPLKFPLNNPGPTGVNDTLESNREVPEPAILVCTLLCYLGIPPAMWKSAVEFLLLAVAEQYRSAYGIAQAEKEFRAWKNKFSGYSTLKVLKLILEFSTEGKLSFIRVSKLAPSTVLLQKKLQTYLVEKGAKLAAQQVAAQVLRKVILVTELAFAGGCLGLCTAEAGGRAIVKMTQTVAAGVVEAMNIIDGVGQVTFAIGVAVFIRPVLVARASIDQSNWVLEGLPASLTRDLNATFGILWVTKIRDLTPDGFLAVVSSPLASLGIPTTLLRDISSGLAEASPPKHGLVGIFLPPEILQADTQRQKSDTIQRIETMKLYEFVQYLAEKGYLRFKTSPEVIADRELGFV